MSHTGTSLPAPNIWQKRAPFLIFALALAVRIGLILITGDYRRTELFEMERVARSIAYTHQFANPYLAPTGPTGHLMPGYALVLSTVFILFSSPALAELVKQVLACTVSSLLYALLPFASESFGLGAAAGMLSGIAGALLPIRFRTETRGDWEAPWTALLLLLIACWTVRAWRQGTFTRTSSFLRGLLWGLCTLFSATVLPVFAGVLLAGWRFRSRTGVRAFLESCALSVAGVLLALTPWVVRNELVFQQPVFTRTNFGLELFVSNNDLAAPTMPDNLPALVRWHPLFSSDEVAHIRVEGEPAYNHRKMQEASLWIESHPARFLQLTAARLGEFWFYVDSRPAIMLPPTLITLAGFWGLWLARKTNPAAVQFCFVVLLLYPAVYYLLQISVRYRYPIDWIFLLFGSYGVLKFWWPTLARPRMFPAK